MLTIITHKQQKKGVRSNSIPIPIGMGCKSSHVIGGIQMGQLGHSINSMGAFNRLRRGNSFRQIIAHLKAHHHLPKGKR